MRTNRIAFAVLSCWLLVGCGDDSGDDDVTPTPDAAATVDAAAGARRLVLFHTNDEHSHLFGFGPEIDDYPPPTEPGNGDILGSAARRATLLEAERTAAAADGAETLTVSSGDVSQGALPQVAYRTTSPDFVVMRELAYDVMCPGNHEFDQGPDGLAAAIAGAQASGGMTQVVATNIHFSNDDPLDDALEDQYGDGDSDAAIKPYHVITTPSGLKVGFIGIMGIEASYYAPFKVPVLFSARANQEGDYAAGLPRLYADIEPSVQALREEAGVDLVVALSHSGVNLATPEVGEDYQIAANVEGIDVIISGHSHTVVPEPIMVEAPDGYMVPIVQAGAFGEWLGRLELVVEPGQRPTVDLDGSRLIKIDDTTVPTDQDIIGLLDDIIDDFEATDLGEGSSLLEDYLTKVVGEPVVDDPEVRGDLYYKILGHIDFDVIGLRTSQETDVLNLSTDAMMAVAEERAGFTMVAVQASGNVRADLQVGKTGDLSFADLYRTFPLGMNPADRSLGYPLSRFYITLVEIRAAFELAASVGLVLDSQFLTPAGIRVEFDTSLPAINLAMRADLLDAQKGRVTPILMDNDHSDGWDNPDIVVFDKGAAPGEEWNSELGNAGTLYPVTTSLYIASFAASAGVTLKDENGVPVALEDTILRRDDDSEIRDWQAFAAYVYQECLANGGTLPSRYDETTEEGAIPRRMVCSGPLCPP